MWHLGEVVLQEEEEGLGVVRVLDFKILVPDLVEMTSQVLGVVEEVISASEDLVEAALGENIALEALTEVVEALKEVDLVEYKVLAEGDGAVDKVPVGCVKAPGETEEITILVVEGGMSKLLDLVTASTLAEEVIMVMIPGVKTLNLEWEGARSIHRQAC